MRWNSSPKIITILYTKKNEEVLTSPAAIDHQHKLLQLIRDVLNVSEDNYNGNAVNPVLALYKSLTCWITHIKENTEEYISIKEKAISTQNRNSKGVLEIRNIFAVRRPAEDIGFPFDVINRQHLFHGSAAHNILGILSRGLLLNKSGHVDEAKAKKLGNGIYFSESFGSSAVYSPTSKTTGSRFIVMADVALGKCFITESAMPELTMPPADHQSVQGVPTGSPGSDFQDSEFVVYQESQQKLAYLIEFAFEGDLVRAPSDENALQSLKQMEVGHINPPAGMESKSFAYDTFDRLLFATNKITQFGLQSASSSPIPISSVHIRANVIDLASKVVIFQEYANMSYETIEAKYVFPLDDLAAVCGFEAFINDKHVIGVIEEKQEAHKQYHEAVAEGHGAYLMDESGQDIFTITVGNLPTFSRVVIKITYVSELKTDNEHIVFELPGCVMGNVNDSDLKTNIMSVRSGGPSLENVSLQIGIEMPFDIRRIISPNHNIIIKKTNTMATVKLCKGQNIANGFQLWIDLAEVHVPRMWVEKSEHDEVEASMLAFYPVFSDETSDSGMVIVMIDASNSMERGSFQSAQTVALLALHHLNPNWKFNVILFGAIYEELFPVPQLRTTENFRSATKFILEAMPNLGCTDLSAVLRSCFLLPPQEKDGPQNIFLISDGNINNASILAQNVMKHSLRTRMFTFGIGSSSSPCNQHLLKTLANKGAGAFEYFDDQMKFKWQNKVKQQNYKASQPALTDIQVEWQQLDENAVLPVRAPRHILSLFNGTRQVVYGFVAHCTMATLTAKVSGNQLSAVVSTSELSKTTGCILHSLAAKAIIRDWSDGYLDEDLIKDEATKMSMNSYIISLSKKYGILSSLTSYIAIEKRDAKDTEHSPCGPGVLTLVNEEKVDKLAYIQYDIEDSKADNWINADPKLACHESRDKLSSRCMSISNEHSPTYSPMTPNYCSLDALDYMEMNFDTVGLCIDNDDSMEFDFDTVNSCEQSDNDDSMEFDFDTVDSCKQSGKAFHTEASEPDHVFEVLNKKRCKKKAVDKPLGLETAAQPTGVKRRARKLDNRPSPHPENICLAYESPAVPIDYTLEMASRSLKSATRPIPQTASPLPPITLQAALSPLAAPASLQRSATPVDDDIMGFAMSFDVADFKSAHVTNTPMGTKILTEITTSFSEMQPRSAASPSPIMRSRSAASPSPIMRSRSAASPSPIMRSRSAASPPPIMRFRSAASPSPIMRSRSAASPPPIMRSRSAASPPPIMPSRSAASPPPIMLSRSAASPSPPPPERYMVQTFGFSQPPLPPPPPGPPMFGAAARQSAFGLFRQTSPQQPPVPRPQTQRSMPMFGRTFGGGSGINALIEKTDALQSRFNSHIQCRSSSSDTTLMCGAKSFMTAGAAENLSERFFAEGLSEELKRTIGRKTMQTCCIIPSAARSAVVRETESFMTPAISKASEDRRHTHGVITQKYKPTIGGKEERNWQDYLFNSTPPFMQSIELAKSGLPACSALMIAITRCRFASDWPVKIRTQLSEVPSSKEDDFLIFQSQLDKIAEEHPVQKGLPIPTNADIWAHQTHNGCFLMDTCENWLGITLKMKITKKLEQAGLLSMGGIREHVLNMCCTLVAVLTLWKDLWMHDAFNALEVTECLEGQKAILTSHFQSNFSTLHVVKLLKALAYIMWVCKRNPLLYNSLHLIDEDNAHTWECFIFYLLTK